MPVKILWITNHPHNGAREPIFENPGIRCIAAADIHDGLCRVIRDSISIVLITAPLAGCTPEDAVARIHAVGRSLPVVIHLPGGTQSDAVRLTQAGAFHTIVGELGPERFEEMVEIVR